MQWLDALNEPQRTAVSMPMEHTLVLAGAGSGKTRVLVSRITWLVQKENVSPEAILAVTFTNKAASEMKSRLNDLLSTSTTLLWVGTFHSLCHRLLRKHYQAANLPATFQIIDTDDQGRLIKRILSQLNLDIEQYPVKQIQAFINTRKEEGLRAAQVTIPLYGPMKMYGAIYTAYEKTCQLEGLVDFSEILLRTLELLRDNAEILAHYHQRFRAILVDEFQDTNAIQYAWVRLLTGADTVVMAVGDDDQSIYGWRGAKVEHIEQFMRDFPAVRCVRLEQNYRSTGNILSAANALIAHNDARMGKDLWTAADDGEKIIVYAAFNELEEARFVSERVNSAIEQGVSLQDIAVLYRSNAQSRVLEEAFLRTGISYHIHAGMKFFERAEIKDVLAYLRLVLNPDDNGAFLRIINWPVRGLGEKTIELIQEYAVHHELSLWASMQQGLASNRFTARATGGLTQFKLVIESLQNKIKDFELDAQIKAVIEDSGLWSHYEKVKGLEGESRLENMQELVNAARQFQSEHEFDETLPRIVQFLGHIALSSGAVNEQDNPNAVQLMTLHAAKGLEFPIVFLVGMEEGVFPSRPSQEEPGRLEEERRLCYVGMTRAMEQLIMCYAIVRRQYGREERHRPSRFLAEIPKVLQKEIGVKPASSRSMSQETMSWTDEPVMFPKGSKVTHAKFGMGIVIATEGSGPGGRVQVRFKNAGEKWLVLAYANLQREEYI